MRRSAAVMVLSALCLFACGCERTSRPNILLVVVDTLRADRLGPYGNTGGLTPFLDGLAAQGTVFLNAYSTTSYTEPAVASLFTSRYPSQHHVIKFEAKVADPELTLAEQLAQAGYTSAGFAANFLLSAPRGYAQGFDLWRSKWPEEGLKVRAGVIKEAALTWVDRVRGPASERPRFLYLHYMEPHAPYEPPQRSLRRHDERAKLVTYVAATSHNERDAGAVSPDEVDRLESLYDGEVAELDTELRLMFDELGKRGFLQHAVVVVTADHGEAFNEHGQMGHDRSLFNELIHIPLIVVAPSCAPGTVAENVSLVDAAPTILELAGLRPPASFAGRSLVPLLQCSSGWGRLTAWWRGHGGGSASSPVDRGTARGSGIVLFELQRRNNRFDMRRHTVGLIRDSTKLLLSLGGEHDTYDLANDPGERSPQRDSQDEKAWALRATLEATRARLHSQALPPAEGPPVDEATKEKLRALGYDP